MVKLATARECRMYGPRLSRSRSEYMNAGLYVFATAVVLLGFVVQLWREARAGTVVVMMGMALIVVVNIHDLVAHLAGIDYRLGLMGMDTQLPLVEVAVPVVQAAGGILFFLGLLFLLLQGDEGYVHHGMDAHGLNMVIAGAVLWVVGSIHNLCQIYERADGHVQILQQCVQIPFLLASFLFLVAAILNTRDQARYTYRGSHSLTETWVWMGIFASLFLVVGGLTNVVKVFKMLQMDGVRLEKLRGGAQERLLRAREGHTPFLIEEQQQHRRRPRHLVDEEDVAKVAATPYKDVLVGQYT